MATPAAFIEGLGGLELMMVLFVVLLLFGAKGLPDIARGLGRTLREFKKATGGVEEEIRSAFAEPPHQTEESRRFAPKPVTPPPKPATPPAESSGPPPAPETTPPRELP